MCSAALGIYYFPGMFCFRSEPGQRSRINQYRFIQEDVARYTLWLNGNKDEIDEKAILDFISPYFGEEAQITVEYVDEIPVLNSGKRKSFENRCEKYNKK